jgi:hypothetical protein
MNSPPSLSSESCPWYRQDEYGGTGKEPIQYRFENNVLSGCLLEARTFQYLVISITDRT